MVKNVGAPGKVLLQGIIMWNIKAKTNNIYLIILFYETFRFFILHTLFDVLGIWSEWVVFYLGQS